MWQLKTTTASHPIALRCGWAGVESSSGWFVPSGGSRCWAVGRSILTRLHLAWTWHHVVDGFLGEAFQTPQNTSSTCPKAQLQKSTRSLLPCSKLVNTSPMAEPRFRGGEIHAAFHRRKDGPLQEPTDALASPHFTNERCLLSII